MRYQFFKMHGCGNDFLILDSMRDEEPPILKSRDIQYLCNRHFGLGADGVVLLYRSRNAHAQWKFYNCDGSEAEMCGNAARCALRLLSDRYFPGEELLTVETKIGLLKGKRLTREGYVEVAFMAKGHDELKYVERLVEVGDSAYRLYCIDTGVPHAVMEVKDIRNFPITQFGHTILHHDMFKPEGTNVTFFQSVVGPQILATTYERGVEKETFACGTGAAAAAIIYSELYIQPLPIEVQVPGGTLMVDRSPVAKKILLRGPTEYVAEIGMDELPIDFEVRELYEQRK